MSESAPTSPAPRRWCRRVLLVGWDGADWKMIEPLIERGQMPNLARFIEAGVMGNIASLRPMISPILWTSIATGKQANEHQILGFAEPDPQGEGIRPVTSTSRRCKALWNILSDAGLQAGVVNWFASHPAESINGFIVTDQYPHPVGPPDKEWPAVPNSVHPQSLREPACGLRIHPALLGPAALKEFLPTLGSWDASQDSRVGALRAMLARCTTVHTIATWLMQEQEWDFCGIYYDAVDRFAHAFMEYFPPRMPHVSEEDFERFQHVMTACYKFHDMMLGRLMDLAGDDTTVILLSDHGFHCDELRPAGSAAVDKQPVAWHRPHGILAMHGPHIKADQRVYGASLLDITPTVLMLLGLPVARDMAGNALHQVLDVDPAELSIETCETYENGASSVAVDDSDSPWVAEQMLAQLAALGYIERGDGTDREKIILDRERNLAQVHAAAGRAREAIECYRRVIEKQPDDFGSKMACAMCYLQLRDFDACETLAREVLSKESDGPQAHLIMGIIEFHRRQFDASLLHLKAAQQAAPALPGVHRQLGLLYLRRHRWKLAERAFRRAIELDPHDAESYDGLGVALRWQKRPAEAVEQHMRSVSLMHYRPLTHVHLGLALAEVGRIDWAVRAFEVALEMNPGITLAHDCLAELFERGKHDPERARTHRDLAASLRGRSQAESAPSDIAEEST